MKFFGTKLTCQKGDKLVFENLDFSVQSGNILILTGKNGSGKTSLLRIMAGLAFPSKGYLSWNDGSVKQEPEKHKMRLNFVGHLNAIKSFLSVQENLTFWAQTRGKNITDVHSVLVKFELDRLASISSQHLSSGQSRKLALARLLLCNTPLWLLDEPTVALDQGSIINLEKIISVHCQNGGMAVIATNINLNFPGSKQLNLHDFSPGNQMAKPFVQ